MADKRRRLAGRINLAGKGVHSGSDIHIVLRPHQNSDSSHLQDKGIVFIRTDLADRPPEETHLSARYDRVVDTRFSTTIGNDYGVTISTIEHLMAAFAGCGVDDAVVEIDGAEVPIMDGSSHIFVEEIRKAGIATNGKARNYIRVLMPVAVEEGDAWAQLVPADEFEMDVAIDFDNPVIGKQQFRTAGQNGSWPISFNKELAAARTFGFAEDLDRMRDMGLARGVSLDNTIGIAKDSQGKDSIMNQQGLRFADEFVRHKALDAVGDLALAGAPLIGRFASYKSGHSLNNLLLRKFFHQADNFRFEHSR